MHRHLWVRPSRVSIAGLALFAGQTCLGQVLLEDRTSASGVQFLHVPNTSMYPGLQDWMAGAVAVADFNRDGWADIYWSSGGGTASVPVADKLFINNGDGTFTDRAADWGIAIVHAAMGACAGDFDDDGWVDLFVTSFGNGTNNQGQLGKNKLFRNNGNGTFTDVAVQAGVNFSALTIPNGYGCSFGDYDVDGDLDLMVCAWWDITDGNRLFRNDGDGTFTDVTGSAIVFPAVFYGFQSSFTDMDGDGWPELLVSADFYSSRYYRNNRDGTFTDITAASGTGLDQNGMGQCVGDFDRDGRLDWYVTSIFADNPTPLSGEGNKLYMNVGGLGSHLYFEQALALGVDNGGWGWGTSTADFDHDGWLDIVTVNGRPGSAEFSNEKEYFFRSIGGSAYADIAPACGLTTAAEGKATCTLDYDHDGWMDLLIGNNGNFSGVSSPGAMNKLYRNASSSASPGNWLHVTLDTENNPRLAPGGFGARLTATVGDVLHVRFMDSAPSFLGTSELCAHFGLSTADLIDELRIDWPRGYVTILDHVAVNQRLVLESPALCDLNGDGVVDAADLGELLAAWGDVTTSPVRKADFDNNGTVDGSDIGILLGAWTR